MKYSFFLTIVVVIISFIANIGVLAHSGRTDANGGHNNNIIGHKRNKIFITSKKGRCYYAYLQNQKEK